MNDPCSPDALVCDYDFINATCTLRATCLESRWQLNFPSNGFCDPPPDCPTTEPAAGEACQNGFGGPATFCRYPHGACFTYWSCSGQAYLSSLPLPSDACCPATPPADAASCDAAGASCTYDSTKSTCDGSSWSSSPFSGGTGGGGGSANGGGSGGDAGAGGG